VGVPRTLRNGSGQAYDRDIADSRVRPSDASYVEVPVHVRYDAKFDQVTIAYTDPDFNTIFYLPRGRTPDKVAREMLKKYGKMPG
jgi:hypothetical protein